MIIIIEETLSKNILISKYGGDHRVVMNVLVDNSEG